MIGKIEKKHDGKWFVVTDKPAVTIDITEALQLVIANLQLELDAQLARREHDIDILRDDAKRYRLIRDIVELQSKARIGMPTAGSNETDNPMRGELRD